MTSFFHNYDLRGKHPEEIGVEEAEKVGKAYGKFIDAEETLVGRDGRSHGEKITKAFIRGVRATGTDVIYAGTVPSPVIYFGVDYMDLKAGAVVTASHNPPEYTGFKFCKEDALAMSRKGGMEEIERIYESEEFVETERKGELEEVDLKRDYVEFVAEKIELQEELDVAVNFGNGVSTVIGEEMLERLGCDVLSVNQEMDGDFPNHLPDPGDEEAQKQLEAVMDQEDLGILFDGDGDRAGFIVPGYGYVEGDQLLSLLAEESLKREKGKVVHDLRASKLVPEIIEQNGGEAMTTKVGHTYFSELIHQDSEIVFGGELSGHFYFPAFDVPWDDGLFAAALVCQIASEIDLKKKLESYPDYPVSPELRIDCPEEAKQNVIEGVKEHYSDHELKTVDGVKIIFDRGWVLVRPSSTEEKMSVRCEADTEEAVDEILEEVEGKVKELIEANS